MPCFCFINFIPKGYLLISAFMLIEFTSSGIFCPGAGIYIDPVSPVEKAVITHSHSDHARYGSRHYLTSQRNIAILKQRLGNNISVQGIGYSEKVNINGISISLHPAGHIPGSSQVRIERNGEVCVITGDYKRQDDGLCEVFEPLRCNVLVTESTFALPIFRWQSQEAIGSRIRSWWKRNTDNDKVSILSAYTLGKAQRILKMLSGDKQRIFVHKAIHEINNAVAAAGYELPEYMVLQEGLKKKELAGGLLIVPPAYLAGNAPARLGPGSTAFASGWMAVRGARRWRSTDTGFAVSDHADWEGLVTTVRETGAEKVYAVHGFAHQFARWLNENGIAAEVPKRGGFAVREEDLQ